MNVYGLGVVISKGFFLFSQFHISGGGLVMISYIQVVSEKNIFFKNWPILTLFAPPHSPQ
jgi:hypothetical protein